MKTIWNATFEGRQYFVQVKINSKELELLSDPVSELAGGGYSVDLPENLDKDMETLKDLRKIFSDKDLIEIIAFSRSLSKITLNDLNERNALFYSTYYSEYRIVEATFNFSPQE